MKGRIVIDPYEALGIPRDADDERIRAAFRRKAKTAHPDSGGATDAFVEIQKAGELLLDPARRKFFDATGYDPDSTDPGDLQGLLLIESLVNEIVLDEREPGTFDPIARMREKLADDISKSRFHMKEMEGHASRIRSHLKRLERRPQHDMLGHMLRARIEAITASIEEAAKKIVITERAVAMLADYDYAVEPPRQATEVSLTRHAPLRRQ
ncbi:J domain-containing protein [Rhizobium sp. KVB221]|uniref:J domain-containing protein n=1 Tax=Rhizobium setariae TaxID=2801340 RepID=A0A937CLJ7_9HYPH|nr:J domain-containing protein [Rhizobium setariae]MBL0373265.1 J domain-containing protein [Rhizobium setariae]